VADRLVGLVIDPATYATRYVEPCGSLPSGLDVPTRCMTEASRRGLVRREISEVDGQWSWRLVYDDPDDGRAESLLRLCDGCAEHRDLVDSLRKRVREAVAWIERNGGSAEGYRERYDKHGLDGKAVWDADHEMLRGRQEELRAAEGRYAL
jgi:hypothetical protein